MLTTHMQHRCEMRSDLRSCPDMDIDGMLQLCRFVDCRCVELRDVRTEDGIASVSSIRQDGGIKLDRGLDDVEDLGSVALESRV